MTAENYTKTTGVVIRAWPTFRESSVVASGAPVAAVGAPITLANFSPAVNDILEPSTSIAFDIQIPTPAILQNLTVVVKFAGLATVDCAYDYGLGFSPDYQMTLSTLMPITGGFRFSMQRRGGWPAAPTILVRAMSDKGGVNP